MNSDRVQAFSDGVFAILITILVLELKVPEYNTGYLFNSVLNYWPVFFSYILTYCYIGILWLFHHDLFQSISRITPKLNILNLILLFFITLLSFSMSLLTSAIKNLNSNDIKFSCCFYSFLALIISFIFLFIYNYISIHKELLIRKENSEFLYKVKIYPIISVLIYLSSFIVTIFNVYLGLLLLVFGILYHGFAYFKMKSVMQFSQGK